MIITNYQKHYKKTTVTLPNIHDTHRIILLKGANGSGKTTLLKSIANLNHYEGTITIDHPVYYTEELAVFPESMHVGAYLSSLVSISKTSLQSCQYLLNYFKMTSQTDKPFSTLSKGMKQKVNLIQTLMMPSNSYLLDEPLSGLDRTSIKDVLRLIQAAKSQFIIATHNPAPFLKLNPGIIEL